MGEPLSTRKRIGRFRAFLNRLPILAELMNDSAETERGHQTVGMGKLPGHRERLLIPSKRLAWIAVNPENKCRLGQADYLGVLPEEISHRAVNRGVIAVDRLIEVF